MGKPTFDLYYSEYLLRSAQRSRGSMLHGRQTLANAPRSGARSERDAELVRGAPAAGRHSENACFRNNRGQMKVSNLE
jgi:hypothetical protein